MFLSFLLTILIARWYAEDGLGIFASVLSWITPFLLWVEGGTGTLITRQVSSNLKHSSAYCITSIKARFWIGIPSIFILGLLIPLWSDSTLLIWGVWLSLPLIIIQPLYSTFTAIFRAHEDMRPIALLNVGMLLIQITWLLIDYANNGSFLNIFIINTATSLIQCIASAIIYQRYFHHATDFIVSTWKLIKQTIPFAIAGIVSALHLRSGIILLESLTSANQAGIFASAWRIIEAGRVLPLVILDVIFPRLSALTQHPQQFTRIFRLSFYTLIAFASALLAQIFGETLIQLLYGESFIDSILILQLLAWALGFTLIKSLLIIVAYAHQREQSVNVMLIVTLAIRLALYAIFTPLMGIVGIVIIHILIELVSMIWILIMGKSDTKSLYIQVSA